MADDASREAAKVATLHVTEPELADNSYTHQAMPPQKVGDDSIKLSSSNALDGAKLSQATR
jgi:hypothetical protein